jgi:hypothetical protein
MTAVSARWRGWPVGVRPEPTGRGGPGGGEVVVYGGDAAAHEGENSELGG